MTIEEIKKAMQEVTRICKELKMCRNCPFHSVYYGCDFQGRPDGWLIEEGAEENET